MPKDCQEQLKEYEYLCANLPDAMLVVAKDGKLLMISKKMEEMSGYQKEDWLRKNVFDVPFIPDKEKILLKSNLQKRMLGEAVVPYIIEVAPKNGEKMFVEINGCKIKYGGGDAVLLTLRNITKRKKAEEMMNLFKDAIESSSDAIGMSTSEGKHYYQNKTFSEMFGDIGSDPPGSIYVDKKIGEEVFRTIMAGNEWAGEVEMYRKDKKVLNILLRAYAVKDNNGKVVCLVGIHSDITDRKKAEEELKKANEDLEMINQHLVGRELKMAELKRKIEQLELGSKNEN